VCFCPVFLDNIQIWFNEFLLVGCAMQNGACQMFYSFLNSLDLNLKLVIGLKRFLRIEIWSHGMRYHGKNCVRGV
jgi:hypothetical protein